MLRLVFLRPRKIIAPCPVVILGAELYAVRVLTLAFWTLFGNLAYVTYFDWRVMGLFLVVTTGFTLR